MENRIDLSRLKTELDSWGKSAGWKTVICEITVHFEKYGTGDLLYGLLPDAEKSLNRNRQRIQRAFSCEGYQYQAKAHALAPYILAAMPAERRARLTAPTSINYLASLALKECTEAVNALLLGSAPARLEKEINEAIDSLKAMATGHLKVNKEG